MWTAIALAFSNPFCLLRQIKFPVKHVTNVNCTVLRNKTMALVRFTYYHIKKLRPVKLIMHSNTCYHMMTQPKFQMPLIEYGSVFLRCQMAYLWILLRSSLVWHIWVCFPNYLLDCIWGSRCCRKLRNYDFNNLYPSPSHINQITPWRMSLKTNSMLS